MANVWDRLPKRDDPYKEAFRAEWGWFGRWRFEFHRERMARQHDPDPNEKLLWKRSQRPHGIRNLIAGFLVIEGLVALAVGVTLMLAYWPAVEHGAMANPVAFIGLGIAGASMAYMIFVGIGVRLYSLLHPMPVPPPAQAPQDSSEDYQKKHPEKGKNWSDET